jgi:hypothetical protein
VQAVRLMPAFPARYPGQCRSCGERIHELDPIRMTDDGAAHDDCTDAAPIERPEPKPCATCWLTHPEGACDR